MADPTDLAARVAALEAKLAALRVADLPLAQLMRTLEQRWSPDGSMLAPASVGPDQLAPGAATGAVLGTDVTKTKVGRTIGFTGSTCTVTNGTDNTVTFAHGLGFTPSRVIACCRRSPDTRDDWIANVASFDGTNMTVSVRAGAAESFPAANPTSIDFDVVVTS